MATDPLKKRAYTALYRATHREELRIKDAAYYITHREELRLYNATYNATHREEISIQKAAYYITHREEIRRRQAIYRTMHPEEIAACNATYRAANRLAIREKDARRRICKAKSPLNDFTAAQWRIMQEHYDHRCVYCHRRAKGHLTQDHITPLANGGSHTLANIVPACRSCNSKKQTGPPLVPVQPMLL